MESSQAAAQGQADGGPPAGEPPVLELCTHCPTKKTPCTTQPTQGSARSSCPPSRVQWWSDDMCVCVCVCVLCVLCVFVYLCLCVCVCVCVFVSIISSWVGTYVPLCCLVCLLFCNEHRLYLVGYSVQASCSIFCFSHTRLRQLMLFLLCSQ
jgi:hypothetical protein